MLVWIYGRCCVGKVVCGIGVGYWCWLVWVFGLGFLVGGWDCVVGWLWLGWVLCFFVWLVVLIVVCVLVVWLVCWCIGCGCVVWIVG